MITIKRKKEAALGGAASKKRPSNQDIGGLMGLLAR